MTATQLECPLAKRVSQAIQQHPHLSRRNLQFEAHQGRVVLRGTVSTYYQELMAQEALRRLDGVDEIENHLEVCWI
jgi:osmotically-inducible protein OsmY